MVSLFSNKTGTLTSQFANCGATTSTSVFRDARLPGAVLGKGARNEYINHPRCLFNHHRPRRGRGGSQAPAPVAPGASSAGVATSNAETPAQAATSGAIQVSADILKACGLSDADAYFQFDSARLKKQDIAPANTIAVCFMAGPLKGHLIKLVGHADPRGGPEYNITLGQSRADGLETYLRRGAPKGEGRDHLPWCDMTRYQFVH